MFVAGLVTFSAGSLACGLAPGVSVLIAARVVQAIGGGAMVPASLSILLATVPAAARPQAIGTWSALGALGAALGPVIGGLMVQASWRWVFWINLPAGLAAIALALRTLPESRDERVHSRPDLPGATLLAASVGLVAFALVKAPDLGWASPRFLGALAAALVCAAAVAIRSSRHPARPAPGTSHRLVATVVNVLWQLRETCLDYREPGARSDRFERELDIGTARIAFGQAVDVPGEPEHPGAEHSERGGRVP